MLAPTQTPTQTTTHGSTPLSPTRRSTIVRGPTRARSDRDALYDVLSSALICHLGVVVDGTPVVLPTAFGFDLDGPDEGGGE